MVLQTSAIRGFPVDCLMSDSGQVDGNKKLTKIVVNPKLRHLIYTAETHNFPTGVCPFAGATTGTGGRLRDVHATGRGAHECAGVAGYSFGNLMLPGYELPWEDAREQYPANIATPRRIAIEASDGASDYGNKFGEPVIVGFARSFGLRLNGERHEYVKPIMFSGGIGSIDDELTKKVEPKKDMLVVKLGGPVYRIGVGGGSASSVHVQGSRTDSTLDFSAVQRGDAEMAQKLHRVIRACVELGTLNPILSIHDQGAGGNGNVLKELVEGAGAVIECSKFDLGDPTVYVRELWGAEYQESSACLIDEGGRTKLQQICDRERCPMNVVGRVTGDNRIVIRDFNHTSGATHPVDMDLDCALGSMPQKEFYLESAPNCICRPLELPVNLKITDALERVLRLPPVASKRYLTNKVDRSVTGLIAQQQCVGPLHTPCADVGVVALSYFDIVSGFVIVF